jgi:hypothetical protein
VGNKGYQELNATLFANAYSAAGFQGLPTAAPDPRFGEIRQLNNQGWSNYNGFVTALKWHVTNNFTGNFSYTWSHALDTCSNDCLEPFNALTDVSLRYQISPLGLYNPGLNYSNADYDIRHSLNMNYVYNVPSAMFHNWFAKEVLGGWTVAGTLYFHTGYPFSVVDSSVRTKNGISNASGIATQTFLADYVGPLENASCTMPNVPCAALSPTLFLPAAAQHDFGNIARNSFRGPNYFDTDLTLNKSFALTERFHLLIGANFFNVLNHPNFDLAGNNSATNLGTILGTVSAPTSAYGSFQGSAVSGRVIQSQVKLTF